MENTSGSMGEVPEEIKRWNWGAFFLSWIWGFGNNTFIALLMFVPMVNLVMPFVLGAKGSEWAWCNKRWQSVQAFKKVQRQWAIAGLLVFLVSVFLGIISIVGTFALVSSVLKNSQAYQMGVRVLNENPQAVQILGQPISAGVPFGNFRVSGNQGNADISFPVKGPRGSGRVYIIAREFAGQWQIESAVFRDAKSGQQYDLKRNDSSQPFESATPDSL